VKQSKGKVPVNQGQSSDGGLVTIYPRKRSIRWTTGTGEKIRGVPHETETGGWGLFQRGGVADREKLLQKGRAKCNTDHQSKTIEYGIESKFVKGGKHEKTLIDGVGILSVKVRERGALKNQGRTRWENGI